MNAKITKIKLSMVQAYKYNGWLYHTWQPVYIMNQTKTSLFCIGNEITALTSKKNSSICFRHKQPNTQTCWFFFPKEWFNVKITINKPKNKITYYINIASPFLIENGIIKYIDFDIDFKCIKNINSNNAKWLELDMKEYLENKELYHYPKNIIEIIEKTKERVEHLIKVNYFLSVFSYDVLSQCINSIDFANLEPSNVFNKIRENNEPISED